MEKCKNCNDCNCSKNDIIVTYRIALKRLIARLEVARKYVDSWNGENKQNVIVTPGMLLTLKVVLAYQLDTNFKELVKLLDENDRLQLVTLIDQAKAELSEHVKNGD